MKKYTLVVILICSILQSAFCQEFSGVAIDGNIDEVVSKFTQKGFFLKEDNRTKKPVVLMNGYTGVTKIELYIAYDPSTKEVWRFSVYLPEAKEWNQLKLQYLEYRSMLIEKYGQPLSSQSTFWAPYMEGDGKEMEAVINDKIKYSSNWINKSSISITKYKQVMIDYVNAEKYTAYKEHLRAQSKADY